MENPTNMNKETHDIAMKTKAVKNRGGIFHVYLICDITGSMSNQIEGVKQMVATYCDRHYAAQASRIKIHIVTYTENSHGSYVSHYSPSAEDLDKEKSMVSSKDQIKNYFGVITKDPTNDNDEKDVNMKSEDKKLDSDSLKSQRLASVLAEYTRNIKLCVPPHCPGVHASGGDCPENLLYALATTAQNLPAEDTAICFVITDADPHFRTIGISSEAKCEKKALRELSYKKYDAFGILNRIVMNANVILVPILYGTNHSPLGNYFYHQAAAISGGCLLRNKRDAISETLARGLSVMVEGIYGNLKKYGVQTDSENDGFEIIEPSLFAAVTQDDIEALDKAFNFTDTSSALSIVLKREPIDSKKIEDSTGNPLGPHKGRVQPPPLDSSITSTSLPASAGLGALFSKCAGVMTSIKKALEDLGDEKYSNYDVGTVSFQDVPLIANVNTQSIRDAHGNILTPNLTDSRLIAKDGRRLYTVKPVSPAKMSSVSANDIFVIVGNETSGIDVKEHRTITLAEYLKDLEGKYGKLVLKKDSNGVDNKLNDIEKETNDDNLFHSILDQRVTVRYQTTFIPVEDSEKAAMEFGCEMYHHTEKSKNGTPRNLTVLATTQGTALQPINESGQIQKLFHHVACPTDKGGNLDGYTKHWLEVERSTHKVGGEQKETKEEQEDAIKRGKAIAKHIGPKAIGTRFNCLMTLQIPLKQDSEAGSLSTANIPDGESSFCDDFKVYQADISDDDLSEAEEDAMGTTSLSRAFEGKMLRLYSGGGSRDSASSDDDLSEAEEDVMRASEARMMRSYSGGGSRDSASKDGKRCKKRSYPRALCRISRSIRPSSSAMLTSAECTVPSVPMRGGITNAPVHNAASSHANQTEETSTNATIRKYRASKHEKIKGKANAARVSVGSKYTTVRRSNSIPKKESTKPLERSETEGIICTVVLFYTVAGGVPSTADVRSAIDDLEELYVKSGWN